jgi:hypothetical protein
VGFTVDVLVGSTSMEQGVFPWLRELARAEVVHLEEFVSARDGCCGEPDSGGPEFLLDTGGAPTAAPLQPGLLATCLKPML